MSLFGCGVLNGVSLGGLSRRVTHRPWKAVTSIAPLHPIHPMEFVAGLPRNVATEAIPSINLIKSCEIGISRPLRVTIGHIHEFSFQKHKNAYARSKQRGPLVPKHPKLRRAKNLDFLVTYKTMKIKWKRSSRSKRNVNLYLKRRRRFYFSNLPAPQPSCSFIPHSEMPHRTRMPELPPGKLDTTDAFAIVRMSMEKQHKVTVGDLVLMKRIHRKQAGDKVVFGTVLMVGSRDWTIIGKPTVPYAKVYATVEQQTLTKELISFFYKKTKWSRYGRTRRYVTILHIDKIEVDPSIRPELTPPRPVRLIDLWANRFLDPDEMEGVKYKEDGVSPIVEDIYDGREFRPGFYQWHGLTDCYRYDPDPYNPVQERLFAERYHILDPQQHKLRLEEQKGARRRRE